MMNATRKEPFTIDISFDCEVETLRDFTLSFLQDGAVVLAKSMRDALLDEELRCAYVTLSGEETARFSPCDPVYAQVRAVLTDGEELHSEAAEINVVDVLDA